MCRTAEPADDAKEHRLGGCARLLALVRSNDYGYEITSFDVLAAYSGTMEAAKNVAAVDQTRDHIRELLAAGKSPSRDFI